MPRLAWSGHLDRGAVAFLRSGAEEDERVVSRPLRSGSLHFFRDKRRGAVLRGGVCRRRWAGAVTSRWDRRRLADLSERPRRPRLRLCLILSFRGSSVGTGSLRALEPWAGVMVRSGGYIQHGPAECAGP